MFVYVPLDSTVLFVLLILQPNAESSAKYHLDVFLSFFSKVINRYFWDAVISVSPPLATCLVGYVPASS